MEQLEGDKEMRAHVNLYKGELKKKTPVSSKARVSEAHMETDAEDVDDGNDDGDDDEKINLSELLDEMMLSGSGSNVNVNENAEDDSILTTEQAAQIAGIHLATSGFEPADFTATDFKFT